MKLHDTRATILQLRTRRNISFVTDLGFLCICMSDMHQVYKNIRNIEIKISVTIFIID